MMKIIRAIICIISVVLFLWLLGPLYKNVLHIGMIYPLPALAVVILFCLKPEYLSFLFQKFRVVTTILTSAFCVGVVIVAVLLGVMIKHSYSTPQKDSTVIILGCQVHGTRPSLMLYDRMNTALEYINENSNSKIIASGGTGQGESISEAEAIKTYLVSQGVEESRIFVEDKSVNTDENIKFSSKIIKDNKLNENVAIATDGFHQFRSFCFAKENGLKSTAISVKTRWYFSASYYSRELLAIGKMLLLKIF